MSQPVIDTLQVADALRRTGMEQEQAEGLARTLGAELGEHVVVRREFDTGFDGIRAQMDTRFAEVDARFEQVDARFEQVDARFEQVDARFEQVDARFDRMEARMDARMDALAGQFRFGLGLVVALFAAVVGVIGVLHANAAAPQPAPQAMPQPAPQPIALYLPPGTSLTVPDVRTLARPTVVAPGAAATP